MARVVVIGGGIGGMATALFSARRGHEVVVLDRDPAPPAGPPDALARWDRPGVVQAALPHYFLARSTRVLREEAPDVLDALADVGITPSAVRFGPGMEDDRALTARRPVYEATLRQAVEAEPGVEVLASSVRGLVTSHSDPGRVVGVRARRDDGTEHEVTGDLVVDAGGRRTASGRWLTDAGLPPPLVEEDPCDLHYLARHYRLREGEEYPSLDVPVVQPMPYGILLVFIGDNRTFSVACGVSSHDPLRRRLQDPAAHDRFLRAVPLTAQWLGRADPISDLAVMAGLSNRRRRLAGNGRPPTPGLVLVGDASLYTNPALGQGVSLTFWMAQHLAAAVDRATTDPAGVAATYETWVADELLPRYRRQLVSDRMQTRQFRAGIDGAGFLPPADEETARALVIGALTQRDEQVLQVARRVGHLLAHPRAFTEDPSVSAKVRTAMEGPPDAPPPSPLPRAEFEALVGA